MERNNEQVKALVEFALSKVGCGYIYGATGWVCSKARREQQAAQYPEQAGIILGIGAKWDGKQCFDCAQLTLFAVGAGGGTLPSGATSQWNKGPWVEKGGVDTRPEKPCILYRQSGGVMQHTGVYVGDGWVVDARGTNEGVIKTRLDSYPWTHWAMPVLAGWASGEGGMAEMKVPYMARVVTQSGGGISLWTDNAKLTRVAAVPEGALVEVRSLADVKGFAKARHAGREGVADTRYLAFVHCLGEEAGTQLVKPSQGGAVLLSAEEADAIVRMLTEAEQMIRLRMGVGG